MADLVVIGYPDEATADKAYVVVGQLEHDLIMHVHGAAVVVKHPDGQTKMVTRTGATSSGALMGGFVGLIFGMLFLFPVGGLILGGIWGALMGTMSGWGIPQATGRRDICFAPPMKSIWPTCEPTIRNR